jgi:hypothetical protein
MSRPHYYRAVVAALVLLWGALPIRAGYVPSSAPLAGNGPVTTFSPSTPGQAHFGPVPGLPADEEGPGGPTILPASVPEPASAFSPYTPGQAHFVPVPGLPRDEEGPTILPSTPNDPPPAGVVVIVVPEPTSAALALTALGLVGLARRFRA